jgi:hypothetical protein
MSVPGTPAAWAVHKNAVKKQSPSAGTGTKASPYSVSAASAWFCSDSAPGRPNAPSSELYCDCGGGGCWATGGGLNHRGGTGGGGLNAVGGC